MNNMEGRVPRSYEAGTWPRKTWFRLLTLLQPVMLIVIACVTGNAHAFTIRAMPKVNAIQAAQTPLQLLCQVKADNLRHYENDDFHIADVIGVTGQATPVQLDLPPFRPTDYLLLSFRGLPKGFALSSGFRTSDAWLVSAHESKGLQIIPPKDFEGSFTMEVRLIRGQNVIARTNVVRIAFSPPDETSTQTSSMEKRLPDIVQEAAAIVTPFSEEQISSVQAKAAAPPPPISAEQEKYMLGLAQKMLDQNDIAAARSIYLRLAYHKSRRGTLRLAQSFDPIFLAQFQTANNLEDLERARHWYRLAADLGADEALQRLSALDALSR